MVTASTLLIVLVVSYLNAIVGMVGVPLRVREGMRLWADDEGYYRPIHLGYQGFWRSFYINLGFAATSFAIAAVCARGDSQYSGREPIFVIGLVNFLAGYVVACLIPSDFRQVLTPFQGRFWRVALVGLACVSLYAASGIVIGLYVAALPPPQ